MKKSIIISLVIVTIILISIMIGYNIYQDNKTRVITDFYTNNPDTITSMSVMNGNNGDIIVVSESEYKTVTDILSELSFDGKYKGAAQDGWSYRLNIRDDKGEITITFAGDRCDINGDDYNINPDESDRVVSVIERLGD